MLKWNNEKRHREWRETCECKCRLVASTFHNQERWNEGIHLNVEKKRFIWSPSNCECECDKSCGIGENLNYEICKCRKKLVDKQSATPLSVTCSSGEECNENIDEVKTADENECVCSYIICVVLVVIALAISVGTGAYFVYSRWYLKNITHVKFGTGTQWKCAQTTI